MDLEHGANVQLDRSRVPARLHPLIPLIQKWAFESQKEQDRFVSEMLTQRPSEVADFNRVIDEARDSIIEWGKSLPELNWSISECDRGCQSHPYWAFLLALGVREITGGWTSPAIEAVSRKVATEARLLRLNEALRVAGDLFRSKQYREFIDLLAPFTDCLNNTQKAKVKFAEQQVG